MRERPILFSGSMVRAILDGRKTQTRRLVKPQPELMPDRWRIRTGSKSFMTLMGTSEERARSLCELAGRPNYGVPGDRLYVRENFAPVDSNGHKCAPRDAAFVVLPDGAQKYRDGAYSPPLPEYQRSAFDGIKWHPSIHMPRWASRITLEVVSVRVERLQDITEEDAKAEGVEPLGGGLGADQPIIDTPRRGRTHGTHPYTLAFAVLWDTINGDRMPWVSNPWIWRVEFRRAAQ